MEALRGRLAAVGFPLPHEGSEADFGQKKFVVLDGIFTKCSFVQSLPMVVERLPCTTAIHRYKWQNLFLPLIGIVLEEVFVITLRLTIWEAALVATHRIVARIMETQVAPFFFGAWLDTKKALAESSQHMTAWRATMWTFASALGSRRKHLVSIFSSNQIQLLLAGCELLLPITGHDDEKRC